MFMPGPNSSQPYWRSFESGQGEKLPDQCTIKRTGDHCSVWQAECFGTAVETHAGWTVIHSSRMECREQ